MPTEPLLDHPLAFVEKPDLVDFEFRLDDPVVMLPADELFSHGKLVPLRLSAARTTAEPAAEIRSPEVVKTRRLPEASGSDPYVLSPKAPKCSSRWRELLGFKKQQSVKPDPPNPRSLKHFLHRNPKSSLTDSFLSLPLLRDSDSESVSISSRLSLSSSSSSGREHEELPRLSLSRNQPRFRVPRPTSSAAAQDGRSSSRRTTEPPPVDSPRMNASGRIVFQGLERSSSSPGSFNGGPRPRPPWMERSYSANVRVTPVLNVPVCSLRGSAKSGSVFGLGQLFYPQKERDGSAAARTSATGGKVRIERASRD